MDAIAVSHPTDQTLDAYGLGKLDDASAQAVDSHLEGCPDCRHRVAALSSDSFLSRLRDAEPRPRTPPPGQNPDGALGAVRGSGAAAPPPADTLPPELAEHPDYQLLRELGRGGMGVVYLAHNRLMGRDEVLKVVGRHLLGRRGVLDRFLREIRAAARLHHPNVVTAYSAFRAGESVVFAMEYAEGLDLEKLVRSKGSLPVANACSFAHQAALGLQHAHEHGMVHRDIKPGNLMLCRQGQRATVKVLDFGLAKATREEPLDGGLTHEGQMLGTPDFIAPEQTIDAQSADIRADIYSLGCTLYYLLAGQPPFRGKSLYDVLQAHHSMDAKPLNFVRTDVPVELAALVGKMMAKEPGHRFQTPGEVAKALTPFFKAGRKPTELPRTEPGQSLPPAGPATSRVASPPTQSATNPEPAPAPPAGMSRPDPLSASLIEFKETERSQGAAPAVAPPERRRPSWMWPSVVVGVALLGLVAAWGAGVLKVRTKQGTVVFENLPEQAIVNVDGDDCTVEWPAGQGRGSAQITLPAGEHDVQVKINGVVMSGQAVIVAPERGTPFKVTREPPHPDPAPNLGGPREALKPLPRARVVKGTWAIEGDDLVQSSLDTDTQLLFGDPDWSHYDLTLQAKKDIDSGKDNQRFTILFHRQGPGFACWYSVYNDAQEIASVVNGNWSRKWEKNPSHWLPAKNSIKDGQWYSIKVEVRGKAVKCFLDDDLVFDDIHPSITHGRIGLGSYQTRTRFRRIKVTDPDGRVLFEGLPELDPADLAAGTVQPAGGTGGLSTIAPLQSFANSMGMKLALIPPGEFLMGTPDGKKSSFGNEKPQHRVRITRPFSLGVHEVTQDQYRAVVGANPSQFNESDDLPVENVSWYDAIAFCNALSAREGLKSYYDRSGTVARQGGEGYRLPTEAEWEYACRAGSTTEYSFGDDESSLGEFSWYGRNSGNRTHRVGQKRPNAWGLHDMLGNVWEWVGDGYDDNYYRQSPGADPPGPLQADGRVGRGGCWGRDPRGARTACRWGDAPAHRDGWAGFRVARNAAGGTGGLPTRVIERPARSTGATPIVTPSDPLGWVCLFDGKTLSGWKPHPSVPGSWRVEDGVLIGSGHGLCNLYSERGDYKDFHLRVVARVNADGNSGVFFRIPFGGQWNEGGEAQIGGRTNGSMKVHARFAPTSAEAPARPGEWFTLEILADGNHLITSVDGKVVSESNGVNQLITSVDGKVLSESTDVNQHFSGGNIALELCDHQTVVEFRKIEIKNLRGGTPMAAPVVAPPAAGEKNWVSLFDGKTLGGWTTADGTTGQWKVEEGAITCSGPASHLFSPRGDYKNFRYRAEIKINDHGNSGMYFRTQKGPGFPRGYEAQVNSTHRDPVKTGSLYNHVTVKEILVPPETWFTQEVEAIGNHIVIKVNGKTTVDYTDPMNSFTEGHFAWQHHDPSCRVAIRKIEVQEINGVGQGP